MNPESVLRRLSRPPIVLSPPFLSLLLILLALLAAPTPLSCAEDTPTWKAGLGRSAITPEKSIWLAGYGHRNRPAEGKIHDLWIKALALEDGAGRRAVILTSDLLGFPKAMYDRICGELKQAHGLERSQIILSSSHTHSGPVLSRALSPTYPLDDEQLRRIDEYSAWLEKKVVEVMGMALSKLEPAKLSAGDGKVAFAVNRRNNREPEIPKLLAEGAQLKGPNDHSVPVLAVHSPDGHLLAVLFGYACHNTNLDGYLWCGDYAGFAQIALEKSHAGAVAMFWEGCGADQNPLPRRSLELCKKYGGSLAAAVDQVLAKPMRPVAPRLRTAFELVELDFEVIPARQELEALVKTGSTIHQRWAAAILKDLDAGRQLSKSYLLPVEVWRLGEGQLSQLWIVMGGEVVVDYALRFKAEYGPSTWIAGYSNDVMAYIPSRRIQEEGGYEAGAFYVYGLPAPGWARDTEERIAAAVRRLVGKTSEEGK